MGIKITQDAGTPTASIELMIMQPLPDYDLDQVEAPSRAMWIPSLPRRASKTFSMKSAPLSTASYPAAIRAHPADRRDQPRPSRLPSRHLGGPPRARRRQRRQGNVRARPTHPRHSRNTANHIQPFLNEGFLCGLCVPAVMISGLASFTSFAKFPPTPA